MAKRSSRVLLSLFFIFLSSIFTTHAQPDIVILVVDSFDPNPFKLDQQTIQSMDEALFKIIADLLYSPQSINPEDFGSLALQQAITDPAIGGVLSTALEGMDILPESRENCAIQPEGQIHATLGMTSGRNAGIPHGEFVYYVFPELEAHIGLLGNNGINVNTNVVKVDTQGFRTTDIVDNIETAISGNPASRYIVNMSFAIIPCSEMLNWATYQALRSTANDQLGDFDAAKFLQDFQNLTGTTPPPNFQLDQFYVQLSQVIRGDIGPTIESYPLNDGGWYASDDPLRDFLLDPNNNIVSVAAAGNLNYEFPLYPAALDNVISVAMTERSPDEETMLASELASGNWRSLFEAVSSIGGNWGEAMLPGLQIYPMTQIDFENNYGFPSGGSLSAAGSSIAAPQLTYLIAAYLAFNPNDTCFMPPNTLAYIRENSWETSLASDVNKLLSDITATRCGDFFNFLVSNGILP
jgi:hypothetical protein